MLNSNHKVAATMVEIVHISENAEVCGKRRADSHRSDTELSPLQRLALNAEMSASLPLIFLRPCCIKAHRPLSRLSRSASSIMPLKAKILNPAVSGQAATVRSFEIHDYVSVMPLRHWYDSRWPQVHKIQRKNLNTTPTMSSLTPSTVSVP